MDASFNTDAEWAALVFQTRLGGGLVRYMGHGSSVDSSAEGKAHMSLGLLRLVREALVSLRSGACFGLAQCWVLLALLSPFQCPRWVASMVRRWPAQATAAPSLLSWTRAQRSRISVLNATSCTHAVPFWRL
jgi:hypothetical protein